MRPGFSIQSSITNYPYNHVVSTGQSLCEGVNGTPVLSTSPSITSRMFTGGILRPSGVASGLSSILPLVAGSVESLHSSFSNWIENVEPNYYLLVSCHARGGYSYAQLAKGTVDYIGLTTTVSSGHTLCNASGREHIVSAVFNVHGETDHINGTANYANCLSEWQSDLETDCFAITGQTGNLPFFLTQMSSWTHYSDTTSLIPYAQLSASLTSAGKIICIGPKYFLPYSDGLHLTNNGYRWIGEMYAKVYRHVVCLNNSWLPLYPTSIVRDGANITAIFNVPVKPLILDDVNVSNPGNYGFEYYDDGGGLPSISNVELVGDDAVRITLSSTPTGSNQRLRYAYTGSSGADAGPLTGARGCLRDSDNTTSFYGYSLSNWCCHFDELISG